MNTLTRKQLIELGIEMFKASCHDVECSMNKYGQNFWHGVTCEGGGATMKHKMNQDLMTPVAVAREVEHREALNKIRSIRLECELRCNIAAAKAYGLEVEDE